MRAMKLLEYLAAREESMSAFGRRVGLPTRTISIIANGDSRCRIDIAQKIIEASRAQPTPDGETISWPELNPENERGRRRGAA